MDGTNDAIVTGRSEKDFDNDADSDHLSECEQALSTCSTSESGLSNSFLDETFLGFYAGWNQEHHRWQGRWVRDDKMKEFLFSMQAFQFLDLQTFLSERKAVFEPESFCKATSNLDKFLADAELDIVGRNKRFPQGAYHFIDDPKWSKTFTDLFVALKYIQRPDMDLIRFYNLWSDAIVPAITENLHDRITREKFESVNVLTWCNPSLGSLERLSTESGSRDNVSEQCGLPTVDSEDAKSPSDSDTVAPNDPTTD